MTKAVLGQHLTVWQILEVQGPTSPSLQAHVKFKSKISYLGKIISRIHRQMTEQSSFEVTVKKRDEQKMNKRTNTGTSILFV